jgi:hypothetical protein
MVELPDPVPDLFSRSPFSPCLLLLALSLQQPRVAAGLARRPDKETQRARAITGSWSKSSTNTIYSTNAIYYASR